MLKSKPTLYTFRRCPYAIRARMALWYAEIPLEACEVDLRNKPPKLLEISPKGTVPVLQLPDGAVLEESLDILRWALAQADPDGWWDDNPEMQRLIQENDTVFKKQLDRYKYPERDTTLTQAQHRENGEVFLAKLNERLTQHAFLFGEKQRWIDVAIFPFVRQFAQVDRACFDAASYASLKRWLEAFEKSDLFLRVMQK